MTGVNAVSERKITAVSPLNLPGLLSFWSFQGQRGDDLVARGAHPYRLREGGGSVPRVAEGVFGPQSLYFSGKTWLEIPFADCPGLRRYGRDTAVSIIAWIKRQRPPGMTSDNSTGPEAIAGIWNESERQRQYCLFLNITISGGIPGNVSGHVSHTGGPTPSKRYCEDVSASARPVPFQAWSVIGFTFDGEHACSYFNGNLDNNGALNPYHYPGALFDARADFTVGAVSHSNRMGNWYHGLLGGLAIYGRALTSQEMGILANRGENA